MWCCMFFCAAPDSFHFTEDMKGKMEREFKSGVTNLGHIRERKHDTCGFSWFMLTTNTVIPAGGCLKLTWSVHTRFICATPHSADALLFIWLVWPWCKFNQGKYRSIKRQICTSIHCELFNSGVNMSDCLSWVVSVDGERAALMEVWLLMGRKNSKTKLVVYQVLMIFANKCVS